MLESGETCRKLTITFITLGQFIEWIHEIRFRRALFSEDYPSLDPSINEELNKASTNGNHHENFLPTGLSTPNNSPGAATPDKQPFYYSPIGLLQQGAKMIRRTFTGEESPEKSPEPLVPRISRKELIVSNSYPPRIRLL